MYLAPISAITLEVLDGSSSLGSTAEYPPLPPKGLSRPIPALIATPVGIASAATSPGLYRRLVSILFF